MGKVRLIERQYTPTADNLERWEVAMYPLILRMARCAEQRPRFPSEPADFIQEVCGHAWRATLRAWERGRDPVPLAVWIARHAISKAMIGERMAGKRSRHDPYHPRSGLERLGVNNDGDEAVGRIEDQRTADKISFTVAHNPATDVIVRQDWEDFLATLEVWEQRVLATYARGGKASDMQGMLPRHARHARRHFDRLCEAFLSR